MVKNVLVPIDGSENANEALRYALNNHPDADLTVLYVLNVGGLDGVDGPIITFDAEAKKQFEQNATRLFDEAHETAEEFGYDGELLTVMEEGDPANVILEHTPDADVVVMGSRGRKGAGRKLLGSVAEKVVRRSPVTVVVVK